MNIDAIVLKENERLDIVNEKEGGEEEEVKEEKPLYKLKMFQSVGSKIAEDIKKFKTYKPYKVKIVKKEVTDETGIDNIIKKVEGNKIGKDI